MIDSGIIDAKNICCGVKLNTKQEVFNLLSNLAFNSGVTQDKEKFNDALWERENMISTYIGDGFSIPHVQSGCINKASIFIVKLDNYIPWTEANEKVDFIVSMAIPKDNKDNVHIKLLSRIARLLMNEEIVAQIKQQNNQKIIKKIIENNL